MENLTQLFWSWPASLVLVVLSVLIAPFVARFAARRSVGRPVMCPVSAEQRVLHELALATLHYPQEDAGGDSEAGAESNSVPSDASATGVAAEDEGDGPVELSAESFSVRAHATLFTHLSTCGREHPQSLHGWDEECTAGVPDEVLHRILVLDDDAAALSADDAAAEVKLAADDRTLFAGASPLQPSATPDSIDPASPPMERAFRSPTRGRVLATAATLAAMAALLPGFAALIVADPTWSSLPVIAALAALIVLALTTVVISLVDLDTFYLDMPVWAAGSAGAWLLGSVAALDAAGSGRLITAGACVLGVWFFFEASNLLFRVLRGHDGQGFGDTLIVLLTVGVPVLLVGDPLVALFSMVGAQLAGIVGWSVAFIFGRSARSKAFAFGPYLAFGWVLGLLAHVGGVGNFLLTL